MEAFKKKIFQKASVCKQEEGKHSLGSTRGGDENKNKIESSTKINLQI